MAFAQESLVIDVSATDALTPKLEEMRDATKELGTEAKKSLGQFGTETEKAGARAEKGLKRAGDASDVVARKFKTLAKAAVGIFAADIGARVLGFSSALDAINKGADRAARSIQAFLAGATVEEFERRARAAQHLGDILAEIAKEREAGIFRLDVRGSETLDRDVNIRRYIGDPAAFRAAAEQIAQAQERINRITGRGVLGTGLFPRGLSPEQTRAIVEEQRKLSAAIEQAAESAKRQEAATRAAADAQKDFNAQAKRNVELTQQTASARRAGNFLSPIALMYAEIGAQAAVALEQMQRVIAVASAATAARVGLFGFPRAGLPGSPVGRSEAETDAANREFRSRVRSGQAQGGAGYFTPAILAGMKATAIEAKRLTTFAGQAQVAFRDLSQSIQQNFAAEVVGVGFESFRGFFRDVITGAKSAKEAFRDFALNVVSGMADIFAQQLALRAVSGIFGGFGIPLGQARGGYAAGGYNLDSYAAGGVVSGPRPVMLGDNPSRREAVVPLPGAGRSIPVEFVGERGGSRAQAVTINLAVTSLDPRGAADVVLSAMPQIQRALVGALGGTDRSLISAVRGA